MLKIVKERAQNTRGLITLSLSNYQGMNITLIWFILTLNALGEISVLNLAIYIFFVFKR